MYINDKNDNNENDKNKINNGNDEGFILFSGIICE